MRSLAIAAWVLAAPAVSQEYIVTTGPLTDHDFYQLVSCAAVPREGCNEPSVRWRGRVVTVTFAPIPLSYPEPLARELDRALDTAIAQINGAAPGLTLRRVSKSQPSDIKIHLQSIQVGDAIRGTGFPEMDGIPIGAAQVQIHWDGDLNLTDAAIVFAADIPTEQAAPIMIEELTQAMGLMTDIRNPYYQSRSVFSEDSNSVRKLGRQDREALRLHYPAS